MDVLDIAGTAHTVGGTSIESDKYSSNRSFLNLTVVRTVSITEDDQAKTFAFDSSKVINAPNRIEHDVVDVIFAFKIAECFLFCDQPWMHIEALPIFMHVVSLASTNATMEKK